MALTSGLASQLGIGAESTIGTRVAPTKFMEFNSESLKLNRDRIESGGIRAGRRVLHRCAAGIQSVDGGFEVELTPQGSGLLLKHAFGAVSTTGAGPYVHTLTPGDMSALGLTIQVNRPGIDGTNRPFDYLGCSITDWEISSAVNQYVMGRFNVYGMHEDTGQSLASASYPAGPTPFTFVHGSIQIAAGAFDVKSFRVAGDNGLATGRHFIRSTNPERPKQADETGLRSYTGELVADWGVNGLTDYNRFVNGTEAALVLTMSVSASASLVITTNVRFDGTTPNVTGPDLLEMSLPFKCVSSTSDAAAITAVLTNSDATP